MDISYFGRITIMFMSCHRSPRVEISRNTARRPGRIDQKAIYFSCAEQKHWNPACTSVTWASERSDLSVLARESYSKRMGFNVTFVKRLGVCNRSEFLVSCRDSFANVFVSFFNLNIAWFDNENRLKDINLHPSWIGGMRFHVPSPDLIMEKKVIVFALWYC